MLLWERENVAPVSRVAIAGDFLPAGGLQLPPNKNWKDIADGLRRRFVKADVTLMNLECCVNVGDADALPKMGPGDSFSAEADVLDFLSLPGTNVAGLANNHICDYGKEGVAQTKAALEEHGLASLGVGRSLQECPDTCVIQTASGVRIGIWAAARHLPELATYKHSGVEPATRRRAEAALRTLKEQAADFNLAFLHAGLERTNRPDPDDVGLIDQLACLGFDVVAACHSHRISGCKRLEQRSGKPAFCFYGLGSITSGVLYSELEREGLIVLVDVGNSGEIARVEVHPVHLEDSGWGRIPFFADAHKILRRFLDLSEELETGAYRQSFYRDLKGDFSRSFFRNVQAALQRGGARGLATKLGRIRMRHLNRLLQSGLS
jgi:poly-gamma-glutamate synthesis protein (capsule biosynthesis protein)